ncbi:MAG TPA: hypothetical protein VIX80_08530 [Candidatus Kapabacteria bacterium]
MSRAEIIELVDSLSPNEQDTLKEYALYLRSVDQRPSYWNNELEAEYRQYIIDGIAEGEKAMTEGRVYTTDEVRKILFSSHNG